MYSFGISADHVQMGHIRHTGWQTSLNDTSSLNEYIIVYQPIAQNMLKVVYLYI